MLQWLSPQLDVSGTLQGAFDRNDALVNLLQTLLHQAIEDKLNVYIDPHNPAIAIAHMNDCGGQIKIVTLLLKGFADNVNSK